MALYQAIINTEAGKECIYKYKCILYSFSKSKIERIPPLYKRINLPIMLFKDKEKVHLCQ
jgi:hypothetical protein